VAFARVKTTGSMPAICDAAASARSRNSPAAPSLEKQCAAQTPPLALGRVQSAEAAPNSTTGKSFCEMAEAARAANRPTAAALQQRCDAELAAHSVPIDPEPPPPPRQ
jgi:hypothetical protein